MGNIITLLLFVMSAFYLLKAQNYEPQILVLSPNETAYESGFTDEIIAINIEMNTPPQPDEDWDDEDEWDEDEYGGGKYFNSSEFLSEPENIRRMALNEYEFSRNMDFFQSITFFSSQFLAYRFFEVFPNLLILSSEKKSSSEIQNLQKIAEEEGLQYVLNFPKVDIYRMNGEPYALIQVQLYDSKSKTIMLEKPYTGDSANPGFEFSCENGSIDCTINNALSEALYDVLRKIAENSPTLNRQKTLAAERRQILFDKYLTYNKEENFLKSVFKKVPGNILLEDVYQTLVNEDRTQFVALFLKESPKQSFKELAESKYDQHVRIISSGQITDEDFLDDIPEMYAYMVKGVYYNNEWYHEKTEVTYFPAENLKEARESYFYNLQGFSFFKENSTEFNPGFWSEGLFEKVPDLKQDPEWEINGESIWETEEINNRSYIGMFEIVANQFKSDNASANMRFELDQSEAFETKYQMLQKAKPDTYSQITPHSLIYPKERNISLYPAKITDAKGDKWFRFFVMMDGDNHLYEWTYFEPHKISESDDADVIVKQMKKLTDWNYMVNNLDDSAFWENYVLLKENGDFKYLKRLD